MSCEKRSSFLVLLKKEALAGMVGLTSVTDKYVYFVPDFLEDWSDKPVRPTKTHICFAKEDVSSVTLREGTEDRGLVEVRLGTGLLYSFDCIKRDTLELFAALSSLLN